MSYDTEVLLVEDNAGDAEMTIKALQKHHLASKLVHVRDGPGALDFIFSEGEFYNVSSQNTLTLKLILLNLNLPKLNGIQVLQRIRAEERTKRIPVVVLTSSRQDPDIRQCDDLGVNNYDVKPLGFDDFQKATDDLGLYSMTVNLKSQ